MAADRVPLGVQGALLLLGLAAACSHTPTTARPGPSVGSGGVAPATDLDATPAGAPALSDPATVDPAARDFLPTAEIRVAADGSGDYRSLTDAVNAAPTGARVIIAGGNYRGSLVLDKPIILEAEDSRPSIQGIDGPTLVVRTEHVILRELILHAPPTGPVLTVDRGELDIDRCVIVGGDDDGIVLSNTAASARVVRAAITSAAGAGIRISGGAQLELFETELTRNAIGILVDGGTLGSHDGRFAYNGTGLLVSGPGGCTVEGGFFWSNTTAGVHLDGGALALLSEVTVRAPGGVPGVAVSGRSRGTFLRCTVSGTPMEADHHAGDMTREHIATELRDGTDHHILSGLVTIEGQSSPVFRDCLLENALGHGLLIQASAPEFEDTDIVGSVFYNVFLADGAAPVFRRCDIREAGENGLFSWLEAGGLFDRCLFEGNGTYTDDRNSWAQVVLADASTTRFVDCTIRGGGGAGVVASGFQTRGELLRCEVSGHGGVGISVSAGGNPRIHHSTVRDNAGDGLWVTRGGEGIYQDLEFTGNGGLGVHFDQEATASLIRCLLESNEAGGLLVRRSASPRLDECTVIRNRGHGVQVDFDGRVILDDCRVTFNEGVGVLVEAPGRAVLVATQVQDNREQQTVAREGAQLDVQG